MEGTLSQPYLFAAAMYVGMLGAAVYFLLSWLGKILQKRVWQITLDIFYSLLALATMASMLYLVADLKVRGFYFAIYCLGIKPALGWICKLLRPKRKSKSK